MYGKDTFARISTWSEGITVVSLCISVLKGVVVFCVKCGKEVSDDALFCNYCGNRIQNNNEKSFEPITNDKKIKYPIFFLGLFLMVVSMFFTWRTLNYGFGSGFGSGFSKQYELVLIFLLYPVIQALRGKLINRVGLVLSFFLPALSLVIALDSDGISRPAEGAYIYAVGLIVAFVGAWMRK